MGHVSEKTDVYAYGIVLLELLTGKPPFDEETNETLHGFAYELLCDPAKRLAPMLDACVGADEWVVRGERGHLGGRALEMCLVAKRCLEHVRVRSKMQDVMPAVVALAQQELGPHRASQTRDDALLDVRRGADVSTIPRI